MFALFGGEYCYAKGGWHDLLGTYASIAEACAAAPNFKVIEWWMDDEDRAVAETIDWWHVVDIATRKIVAASKTQAHGAPSQNETK